MVTGAGGQLGRELCLQWGEAAVGWKHDDVDVAAATRVAAELAAVRPDVVVNAAAYTAVDQAESEKDACRRVNVDAVRSLATTCEKLGARLVQISTDYVFGGEHAARRRWRETDATEPHGVYATSKADGERVAADSAENLIVRTCGLYPGDAAMREGGNFVSTMLRLARSHDTLRVVNDQWCTPSYVPHVAAAIRFLCESGAVGIYHVTNRGEATWFDVAEEIMRLAGRTTRVEAISTAEYGAAAPRPSYSVLDTSKYLHTGGPDLPLWRDALAECLSGSERPTTGR